MKLLNTFIDHTLLRADASKEEIAALCKEAIQYNFASVCILPYWVPFAASALRETSVAVCTVVGFPLGCHTPETKRFEAEQLASMGAQELDMVLNIAALKARDLETVEDEITKVVKSVGNRKVKVILETCYLTDEEKILACRIAENSGAAFVKTSTGFGKNGATVEDVALMKKAVGNSVGVKASGGIRDYETALKMVETGASRLGTSAGLAIAKGFPTKNSDSY